MSALLICFVVTVLVALMVKGHRGPFVALDVPNERSLHSIPKPRLGGVAILAGTVAGWLWFISDNLFVPEFMFIARGAFLVAIVSLADDYLTFSQIGRLVVHVIAAIQVLQGTVYGYYEGPMLVFLFVSVIWMINLYNFMDGMDGFSGGMTMFGFAFIAIAAHYAQAYELAGLVWCVVIASFGFLLFNFPPASMFMGDVGAATLGYLAAAFSLWGIKAEVFPLWFPLLVFSPFVVDATLTIVRRAMRKEQVWVPHRRHFYQRVVQSGWTHKRTVIHEYILMFLCGLSALAML